MHILSAESEVNGLNENAYIFAFFLYLINTKTDKNSFENIYTLSYCIQLQFQKFQKIIKIRLFNLI